MMMQVAVEDRELVSALADGQLRGEEFARTVEKLGTVDDAQRCWHAYHLVGDVLRSGDAMASARDAAFMQRLRDRLGQEARHVPGESVADLAEENTRLTGVNGTYRSEEIGANDSRFRWKMLAGVASLAMVSVIGWQVVSGRGDLEGLPQLARLPAQNARSEPVFQQARDGAGSEPQVMIRDPQIDALLAAHKQFGGTSALQMPAGFLRNATFEGAAR